MGISEFEESYEEDERQIRGAVLTETIQHLHPLAPVCVRPETSLREAIAAMNAVKAGCVLTTQDQRLVGILTERDVLREVVDKLDLDEPVSAVMTPDPETVRMDDGIALALNKMHVGGYRHIPVVDESGHPTGIVSVRDVVRFIVSLFPATVLNLPPEADRGVVRSQDGP